MTRFNLFVEKNTTVYEATQTDKGTYSCEELKIKNCKTFKELVEKANKKL